MRKKPDIKERECKRCGQIYKPNGSTQQYCTTCKAIVVKERQHAWYIENTNGTKRIADSAKRNEKCCVCGNVFSSWFEGKPYCNKHWLRMYTWGDVDNHPRAVTNTYEECGDVLIIKTKKDEIILTDLADKELVKKHSWCVSKQGYAVANIGGKTTKINSYLLGKQKGFVIDHINNNKLDNRRSNLRFCTQRQNMMNQRGSTDRHVGVRQRPSGKWSARITFNRKEICIGTFDTYQEAVKAREEAEDRYFGDYANHKNT